MKLSDYIPTKRCKPESQGGCGERFEKNAKNFFVYKHLRKDGSFRLDYSLRCRSCHREWSKQEQRRKKGLPVPVAQRSSGPQPGTAIHAFYCRLPPVVHEVRAEGAGV